MNRPCVVLTVFLLLLPALTAVAGTGALDEILGRQGKVETVKARFVQEKHALLLDRPIRSEGFFYYAADRGVRWQYDNGMLVVYDGEALYVFDPETMRVEKIADPRDAVGPLNFDIGLLSESYDMKAERTAGGIVVNVTPRKEMPFESMELRYPTDSPFPEKVVMTEPTGDRTLIRFQKTKINGPVPDNLLEFHVPPGATVTVREQ